MNQVESIPEPWESEFKPHMLHWFDSSLHFFVCLLFSIIHPTSKEFLTKIKTTLDFTKRLSVQ